MPQSHEYVCRRPGCDEHETRIGGCCSPECETICDLLETIKALETERDKREAACADALEKLWREIVVARCPDYGDWEYPGQAYRHIKAVVDELEQKLTVRGSVG